MAHIRYTCREGDRTTAGGVVELQGHRNMTVYGRPAALEGDVIFCPVCKQDGRVESAGPRLGYTVMGRRLALSDDECRCGCFPAPRLIASQTNHRHVIEPELLGTTPATFRETGRAPPPEAIGTRPPPSTPSASLSVPSPDFSNDVPRGCGR